MTEYEVIIIIIITVILL